jgi:hypothetical protein
MIEETNIGDDETIELDTSEAEEVEIELSDESEEKSSLKREENKDSNEEDEHEQYSASVQKRIDRLTKKMREAERQREEALTYAQNVKKEADQLKTRVKSLDEGYMIEYGTRLQIEQQQVEKDLKRAVDLGDSDATVAAQKRLTELAVAADRYNQAKRTHEAQEAYEKQQSAIPPAPEPVRRPDVKAESWASKNSWFGQDEAMTFAAFGIHKKLVEDEGFDPKSDEYYSEIDHRIRNEFPHKFKDETTSAVKKPVQNVAGGSRSSARPGRTMKLTPSQVAIAKKLGVPLEEYAKYVKQ